MFLITVNMLKIAISLALVFIGNISVSEQCGYNVSGTSGSIQSPNYPAYYGENLNCIYAISTLPDAIIYLEIVDLDTEITWDTLYIYDGFSTYNRTLIQLSGPNHKNIFLFNATTNEVLVRLNTDSGIDSYRGFNITFHVNECRDEMYGSSGIIKSRNYPMDYYNNMDCTTMITTPEDTTIVLEILDLDMESCCDFIKIYDGPSNTSKSLGIYTGQQSNIIIYASTNQVFIYYYTDPSVTRNGFQIAFTARENCEQDISGSFGTVISPGYPIEPYGNNQDCYYKITAFADAEIHFEIVDMNLQPDYDYIEIYGGHTTSSQLIGRYTGNLSRVDAYGYSKEAMIYFHSDDSIQSAGFYINFEEIEIEVCHASGSYTADSGVIISPLYQNSYPNNSDCYYYVKTSENTQIMFHVESFDVELSDNCAKDFLEIYDGPITSTNLMAKFCGLGPFPDILSSTNEARAYFHSDNDTGGSGFRISYDTNPCPEPIEYSGDFGTINSPGYPQTNYPNFANCKYAVVTPYGSSVQLTVIYMNVESVSDCSKDYLRIYDGSEESDPVLAQLCGETPFDTTYQASTHKILLEFHSDGSINEQGFSITYSAAYT